MISFKIKDEKNKVIGNFKIDFKRRKSFWYNCSMEKNEVGYLLEFDFIDFEKNKQLSGALVFELKRPITAWC